jgi:hypothetical protein
MNSPRNERSQSRGLQPTGRVYEVIVCSDAEELNRRTVEQFVRLATESVADGVRRRQRQVHRSSLGRFHSKSTLFPVGKRDLSADGALVQGVLFLG